MNIMENKLLFISEIQELFLLLPQIWVSDEKSLKAETQTDLY